MDLRRAASKYYSEGSDMHLYLYLKELADFVLGFQSENF
jgi:hypothetical protein